jgi:signal-transduction protein with cAMP-binding, CBS, and nucleotidyltransferase domain
MPEQLPVVEKRVQDVMHRGVITCTTGTLLKELVRIITDTDVHALVVVDDNDMVAGIVSHMDLLRLYNQNLLQHKAEDVMTRNVVTIQPLAYLGEAVALMIRHNIRRVLVVEDGPKGKKPIGVVSTTDVMREMSEQPWYW